MGSSAEYRPDCDALQELLLELAGERSIGSLLSSITTRLADQPGVALARVWLIDAGDICQSCPMRAECPDQTECLHLVASAGRSVDGEDSWDRVDGDFRRIPLGVRKVGRTAASGQAVVVPDAAKDHDWIARPDWARREGILGFAGQPLLFKGKTLGVLAVFTRATLAQESLKWLRLIADHAAAAIATARAFDEIERLRARLSMENEYLREEVMDSHGFCGLIGQGPAHRNLVQQIALVAPTEASVLIQGESGTGKELVACEIHHKGARRDRPMVRVNCASIPRELYESEFFGHVRGAFTGAIRDRAGRFELADGGTLFLDEVGEIPPDLQSKLLRVIQEGQYERIGDERTRRVDVRIIAATNRDLKAEVEAGRFRQDLYYRINVFPIDVAPLRQRIEDIPMLATHFLERAAKRLKRSGHRLTPANIVELQRYDWRGNVRELQNVIERAVITARAGVLRFDLPRADDRDNAEMLNAAATRSGADAEVVPDAEMERRARENVARALDRAGWKIYGRDGAAELLGMRPTTLASRVKRLGLKRPV